MVLYKFIKWLHLPPSSLTLTMLNSWDSCFCSTDEETKAQAGGRTLQQLLVQSDELRFSHLKSRPVGTIAVTLPVVQAPF